MYCKIAQRRTLLTKRRFPKCTVRFLPFPFAFKLRKATRRCNKGKIHSCTFGRVRSGKEHTYLDTEDTKLQSLRIVVDSYSNCLSLMFLLNIIIISLLRSLTSLFFTGARRQIVPARQLGLQVSYHGWRLPPFLTVYWSFKAYIYLIHFPIVQ